MFDVSSISAINIGEVNEYFMLDVVGDSTFEDRK